MYEDDRPLGQPQRVAGARVSLPSDRSFASYEQAIAHIDGAPLATDIDLYWNQAMLDVVLDYDIQSEQPRSPFARRSRGSAFTW